MREKIKTFFYTLVDMLFMLSYIATIVLAILDIFGVISLWDINLWTKILVLLFGTVGITVLSDKHKLDTEVNNKISAIATTQSEQVENERQVVDSIANIGQNLSNKMEVLYFRDKTQFYLYLTQILLKLPGGSQIDVTNFEKNYNIPYDAGENIHIESFMKAWTETIKAGKVTVRHLVHITSPQDYTELLDRISTFSNNPNYTISAIIGLPSVPFEDFMILNQEYVCIGLSSDISSPNNLSFGYAIRSKELAISFQNHFNIYWSNQFSITLKDKDEIKKRQLNKIKSYTYDVEHNTDLKKFHQIMPGLYNINEHNSQILRILEILNRFYNNVCYEMYQKGIEKKTTEYFNFINNQMRNFLEFDRDQASDLLAKMIFKANSKILATSLDIGGTTFWTDDEGEKVFQANMSVVTVRNIHIERIFVCSKDKKTELQDIISAQRQVGIEIYYTEYKEGMGATFEDFMIVDDESLLVFKEDKIKISINPAEIESYCNKFKAIKQMGIKIE